MRGISSVCWKLFLPIFFSKENSVKEILAKIIILYYTITLNLSTPLYRPTNWFRHDYIILRYNTIISKSGIQIVLNVNYKIIEISAKCRYHFFLHYILFILHINIILKLIRYSWSFQPSLIRVILSHPWSYNIILFILD